MVKLLKDIIDAHGGIVRWNQFNKIEAQIISGGKLFELKGIPQDASPRQMTVWLHEQSASIQAFGNADQKSGSSPLLWTYLTTPFFMLLPGIEVNESDPWQEGNEIWKGLSVTFPSYMATHSAVQNFYFGKDNLIRRNDYQIDIDGNFYVAQYISDLKDVEGILVPSKRRAYKRDPDGKPLLDELMVKVDLSNFQFS